MLAPVTLPDGRRITPSTYARAAGITFESVDKILGKLGRPLGLKSYKPFYTANEAFLQSFLGMAGLPIEMVTAFPSEEPLVLLTAQAADDPSILSKIEHQLLQKKSVIITSGLLRLLQERGIRHIAEVELPGRTALVGNFLAGGRTAASSKPVLIPQLTYRTNDSWEVVSAIDGDNGWPLLHDAPYAGGHLYILVVPENFSDLSELPEPALTSIRQVLTRHLPVQLEAPGKVSLFLYDNDTFIVESFRDEPVDICVAVDPKHSSIEDLSSGENIATHARKTERSWDAPHLPERRFASLRLPPHSYRTFKIR